MTNQNPKSREEEFEFTMYDLRGPWAERENKLVILRCLNKKLEKKLQAQESKVQKRAIEIINKYRTYHCGSDACVVCFNYPAVIEEILNPNNQKT